MKRCFCRGGSNGLTSAYTARYSPCDALLSPAEVLLARREESTGVDSEEELLRSLGEARAARVEM